MTRSSVSERLVLWGTLAVVLMLVSQPLLEAEAAKRVDDGTGVSAETAPGGRPETDVLRFGTVELSTGVRVHYAETGSPDGLPVVMLHGYTDSWRSFRPVLPHLPKEYRVVMPDQRGHGSSAVVDCCYRIRDLEADVIALLDALGIESAVLVGHSSGSIIAQRVAADHQARVQALVLIGSGVSGAVPPLIELQAAVNELSDPVDIAFAREFQRSTVHTTPGDDLVETMSQGTARVPAHVWRSYLDGLISEDMTGVQARIRAPTLLVAGELDGMWPPAEQRRLAAAIAGSELKLYAGTAHALHWEQPAAFAADLHRFLTAAGSVAPPSRAARR